MSAFYVGQRVRIIGADNHPRLIGREGVIVSAEYDYFGMGHEVVVQGEESWFFDGVFHCNTYHLEPIAPPGLESLEEINALYEPSPVEART